MMDAPNPNPSFYIANTFGLFVNALKIGDKVVLKFKGEVEGERKPDDDDDMIIKTIKFNSLKETTEKRVL